MSIQGTKLFNALNHSLAREQKAIEVASDNIARSSIANEQAKELKKSTFHQTLVKGSSQGPLQTHQNHLTGRHQGNDDFKVVSKKIKAGTATLSGNNINGQEEMTKMNKANTDFYETLTQSTSFVKRIKMFLGTGR
ncbi:MAG: flagellar basal body rod protein FlgB [Janthinobacterium lividum]